MNLGNAGDPSGQPLVATMRRLKRSPGRRLALALLAISAFGDEARAQSFDMSGPGTRPCAEFLSDITKFKSAEDSYFYWALGFMSGSNSELRLAGKPRRDLNSAQMPMESQQQALRRFCQQNPAERYLFAVGGLFRNLPIMKDR